MFKLKINRFEDVSAGGADFKFTAEMKNKGFDETAKKARQVNSAFNELSEKPLQMNVNSVNNAINKLKNLQNTVNTLKNYKNIDIGANIKDLKSTGAFGVLPTDVQSTLETVGNMQTAFVKNENFEKVKSTLSDTLNIVKDIEKEMANTEQKTKDEADAAKSVGERFKETLEKLQQMPSLVDQVSKGFKSMNFTKLVSLYRTIRRVTSGLVRIVEDAANYEESLNLYIMALGKYADEATAWSDEISTKLMLDPSDIMQYTGAFYNLTKGLGASSDNAYLMSKNLTQLSYDMSSYLNISVSAAQAKIQSAMAGQSRAVASVGVATQQASLQELAYSLGIDKKVASMTQSEKTYLRYIQLLKTTTQMQGDLGRTMITPANAIRVLKTQITLLGRSIGQALTPFIKEAIPWLIAFTNVATRAITALAKFLGYEISNIDYSSALSFEDIEDGEEALENLGNAAASAGKKAKNSLAPFDDLNQVMSTASTSTSGSGGSGAYTLSDSEWSKLLDGYDMLDYYTDDLVKKAEALEGKVKSIMITLGVIFGLMTGAKMIIGFADLIQSIGIVKTAIEGLKAKLAGGALFGIISKALVGITGLIAGIGLNISAVDNAATDSLAASEAKVVGSIAGWTTFGAVVGSVVPGIGTVIGGAIGTLIGASTVFVHALIDEQAAVADSIALKKDEYGEIIKLTDEVNKYNDAIKEKYNTLTENNKKEQEEIESYKIAADRLNEIVDASGKVKEGYEAEAKVLIDKLNPMLKTKLKYQDGEITNYSKVRDEILQTLEAKKREILLNQELEKYKFALENESEASENLRKATRAREKAYKSMQTTQGKSKEVIEKEKKAYEEAETAYQNAWTTYSNIMSDKERYETLYVENMMGNYDKVDEILKTSNKHYLEYTRDGLLKATKEVEPGGELSDDLIAAWKSLGEHSLSDFVDAIKEIEDPEQRKKILEAFGYTEDDLVNGALLTGEEYANKFIDSTQSELDGSELTVDVTESDGSGRTIYTNVQDFLNNSEFTVDVTPNTTEFVKQVTQSLKGKKITMDLVTDSSGNVSLTPSKTQKYEDGGFPTAGDLFFANENGRAEFITSIGGKTAVANQDQMVQAVSNAIIAGFNQFGGGKSQPGITQVYIGNDKIYEGQGTYQNRQTDRYGTSYIRI